VGFHGFLGDYQLGGYLVVGPARGDEPEDLRLARGTVSPLVHGLDGSQALWPATLNPPESA